MISRLTKGGFWSPSKQSLHFYCPLYRLQHHRNYRVLAIESSCDDSCFALLERNHPNETPRILDHAKKTLHSADVGGIMPTVAFNYHMSTIANLCTEFCQRNGITAQTPPDLICVTRGPGMSGSLSSSTEFAKGLSVAWNVPLVGVHHMLGHLLTSFLPKSEQPDSKPPQYPFLSLLCSGGHTMLVLSKSVSEHEIIINVSDIAVGDSLDKCARELGLYGNMLGPELEKFVDSIPQDEIEEFQSMDVRKRGQNKYGFKIALPYMMSNIEDEEKLYFAFAHFLSTIQGYKLKYCKDRGEGVTEFDDKTKRMLAYFTQEFIFDHIIRRINQAMKRYGLSMRTSDGLFVGVKDFVCSGGVAANKRLRNKLFNKIKYQEIGDTPLNFHFPDLPLCTDNAVMIGLAGMEIFEKLKLRTDLSFTPIRKWPLNELLTANSWVKVDQKEIDRVCKYNI